MKRYSSLVVLFAVFVPLLLLSYAELSEAAVLGIAPKGKNSLEFIGRSIQEGNTITHFGYLTSVRNAKRGLLFSDLQNQNEATARFTFYATSDLNGRFWVQNADGWIIVTNAPTEFTIYFNEVPNGDFENPNSFKSGKVIATYAGRYQNVLNIQAPNVGDFSAVVDLTQNGIIAFDFNGNKFALGEKGLTARAVITGRGRLTQEEPLLSAFVFGGHVTVQR